MNEKKELMIELKNIYDDESFVCSTMDIARTPKAWSEILDYIKTARSKGDVVTSDDIQLIAIHLRDKEDKRKQLQTKRRVAAIL